MKDMRLFEVGFKLKPHSTSYDKKFYVAEVGGENAIEKARQWVIEDHNRWWENEGRDWTLWEVTDKDFKATGLDDEQYDDWINENGHKYTQAVEEKRQEYLAEIEDLQLARLHDTGKVVV